MTNKVTPCECPMAQYCNRHSMTKNVHFHHLCQTSQKYFNLWEQCRGPGQAFTDCAKAAPERKEELPQSKPPCAACSKANEAELVKTLPSLGEQAKTLAKATVEHAKNGFKNTGEEMRQKRLEICRGCEFYIESQKRCGKCGCFVELKSKWESNHCPVGNW